MADVKVKTIDEIPFYRGPNTIPGIRFHTAGRELGVRAWGMNILAIDAGCSGHPEHDHLNDGQEEVYWVLKGGGTLDAGGEKINLCEGTMVRVGPSTRRKILPGSDGITVHAIGGGFGGPLRRSLSAGELSQRVSGVALELSVCIAPSVETNLCLRDFVSTLAHARGP